MPAMPLHLFLLKVECKDRLVKMHGGVFATQSACSRQEAAARYQQCH